MKAAKKYPTHGISWPDPVLLAAAQARAKAQGRSLSNYIRELIKADVGLSGEARAGAASAAEKPVSSAPSVDYKVVKKVVKISTGSSREPKPKSP